MRQHERFLVCVLTAASAANCFIPAGARANEGVDPQSPTETLNSGAPSALPSAPPSAAAVPADMGQAGNKDGMTFGGQIFLAIQNWSKVGMSGDSKLGVGLGGFLGLGYSFGDMKLMVGPSLWSNSWSADYSQKSQSATDSVYVTMNDAGVSLTSYFDDFYIELGTGSATIKSGMKVGGKDIAYSYDGTSYSYKSVGIGVKNGPFLLGLGFKNYDGLANAANHINFLLGIGF